MRVLVCGGRNYRNWSAVAESLQRIHATTPIDVLIHGCAKGADALAARWAYLVGVRERGFGADWETHGRAAGPIRNQAMLDEGKPDLVVAFPGGAGTADMVRRAAAAGITVMQEGGYRA
jgi:predicted Rossmann-fold nucleotide-binding protein